MKADETDKNPSSVLILGPTASGKSDLAHQLFSHYQASAIISADSRQVYKLLDIGTAKPNSAEISSYNYQNVNLFLPNERDSVASFYTRYTNWKHELQKIIIVGGSTLFQQSILFGLDKTPSANSENLLEIERLHKKHGDTYILDWLKKVDIQTLSKMDGFNTHRIYRALDIFMQTGKPLSSYHSGFDYPDEKISIVSLQPDRNFLKSRINDRVDLMLEKGLKDEIESLLDEGFHFTDPGLNSIGYIEWKEFFLKQANIDATIKKIKTKTWQYAKRQYTWLKRWKFLHPIEYSKLNDLNLDKIIKNINRYN